MLSQSNLSSKFSSGWLLVSGSIIYTGLLETRIVTQKKGVIPCRLPPENSSDSELKNATVGIIIIIFDKSCCSRKRRSPDFRKYNFSAEQNKYLFALFVQMCVLLKLNSCYGHSFFRVKSGGMLASTRGLACFKEFATWFVDLLHTIIRHSFAITSSVTAVVQARYHNQARQIILINRFYYARTRLGCHHQKRA